MNPSDRVYVRATLQTLIDNNARVNSYKEQHYWYPLSLATYDVDEILAAVDALCSFRTTMWEKTAEFEREFASHLGIREAVMVNSGSSADLLIAFLLTNPAVSLLAPDDEVLVPSVTWPTQIWSAMMAGLRVRFVDTDPQTLNVDLVDLAQKIGPRTRALSLVHLMGNPCDMEAIQRLCAEHDLLLLEDCCEALDAKFAGRSVGTFGVASAFSFFFSHHMTTMEGGMICCDDQQLSDVLRLLRAHGWARNTKYLPSAPVGDTDPRYTFMNWGFNVRPTELQAGFGLEQLKRLPGFQETRAQNAAYLAAFVQRHSEYLQTMCVHPQAECSWFAFPLLLTDSCPFARHDLTSFLEQGGVETRPIVAGNLARQPVCALFPDLRRAELPGADVVHERGFYLGIYPVDSRAQLDRLCELFDSFLRKYA